MKEVQMTFRVESELRASFTKAAEKNHRPAAQVLRELMRFYVSQTGKVAATVADTLISADERSRREEAVNFARGCIGLEGFIPSSEDEIAASKYINGEIDLAELVQARPKI